MIREHEHIASSKIIEKYKIKITTRSLSITIIGISIFTIMFCIITLQKLIILLKFDFKNLLKCASVYWWV